MVLRFAAPPRRHARRGPAVGALIALVAFLGSLLAAALGPAPGEALPSPLLALLMLIRG